MVRSFEIFFLILLFNLLKLQMIEKLSTRTPEAELKLKVLTEVAKEHNVKWEPKSFVDEIKKPRDDLLVKFVLRLHLILHL